MISNLRTFISAVVFAAMLFVLLPAQAQPGSSQETLNQYIAALQKNPNDQTLREKIIKLALTMNPKPAIPQDVVMHEGAAEYAIKHAKTTADFADAAKEYEQALVLAPWLATDYFNCGVAYEKAEQFDAAIRNFNLYLAASPGAKDTNDVLKRIGGLEYAGKKSAKESSPEAIAAKKETDYAEWLKKLDGARYVGPSNSGSDLSYNNELVINGALLSWKQCITYYGPDMSQEVPLGQWYDMAQWGGLMPIVGRQAKRILSGFSTPNDIFTISEDGNSITQVEQASNGGTFTFYRK